MKKLKVGVWQAILCATLTFTPYILAIFFSDSPETVVDVLSGLLREAGFEVLSILLGLYSAAIIWGGYAGARIKRNIQHNQIRCYLIGIGLALSCLLAALLTGAVCALLREVFTSGTEIAGNYLILYLLTYPAYIMLYASLPAAILGLLYTFLVVRTVHRSSAIK